MFAPAQSQPAAPTRQAAVMVLAMEGTNAFKAKAGSELWTPLAAGGALEDGDRARTGPLTRLRLRMPDHGVVTIPERTEFIIELPKPDQPFTGLTLLRGMSYFFHRGNPNTIRFKSRTASAAIRGTEFVFQTDDTGRTVLTLIEGKVALSNEVGSVELTGPQQATAEPGRPPRTTAVLDPTGAIQWCLYYPGVLDPAEVALDPQTRSDLRDSLSAYEAGDLLQALAAYPHDRRTSSPDETVYHAALLLSAGQVDQAEFQLESLPKDSQPTRLADALRMVIATVQGRPTSPVSPAQTTLELASAWMAWSYARQAQGDLPAALDAARRATERSPRFGLAWSRVAELEFGFGRRGPAMDALDRSLALAPRNAQAVALKGFLLAADNQIHAAQRQFDAALALDGGLGNAWLGRGLCRIKLGHVQSGLDDLETAAAVEPQRAILRSYLGKAFAAAGQLDQADAELALARTLDAGDPTSWLYAALLDQQKNRINRSIQNLQTSQTLNDNRMLYRSRLMLDQDEAVRGANLASLYLDAGMPDVSRREAARAVNQDYANYSAHLFLANSYQQLRDPNQVDLRFETPWLNEYLLANLLAPPGAGAISQAVSQQEYGRLFERDRWGVVSSSEYLSRGDWTQSGSFYGIQGGTAFALDQYYQSRNGQRPNNDLEQLTLSLQLKQQLTPEDSVFLQTIYYDADGGDLARVYDPEDPSMINRGLEVEESQEPVVLAGFHHAWSPSSHTLFLAGRLEDDLKVTNPQQRTAIVSKDALGVVTDALDFNMNQRYHSELEIYTTEAQQIWQQHTHAFIAGTRYQFGQFDTDNRMTIPTIPLVNDVDESAVSDFQRWNAYGYYQWRVLDPVLLIGGLSYDWVKYPVNHRFGPLSDEEKTTGRFSPKAGLEWAPLDETRVRFAYAQSLGGVSFDQSYRLEPSQVAGINQAYRSIIPESAAGSTSAPRFETLGVEWDQRFATRTYLGLRGELLTSKANREVGVFDLAVPPGVPSGTREHLDYRERSFTAVVNQLLADEWSAGVAYRLSQADLDDSFVEMPSTVPSGFVTRQDLRSTLHQVRMFTLFNHASGFFWEADALWSSQSNHGYSPDRPGDDFWQFNVWAGWRFLERRAEVRLGLLNLADQDYKLNPLNLTAELPRERTLAVNVRIRF